MGKFLGSRDVGGGYFNLNRKYRENIGNLKSRFSEHFFEYPLVIKNIRSYLIFFS